MGIGQNRAKEYAAKHGFKLRRVPHSLANPNGYVKVIAPDVSEHRTVDWSHAYQVMLELRFGK